MKQVGVISSVRSGFPSKKPKPAEKITNEVVAEESGIEDVYIIPDMIPKTVIMSEEMRRRQSEDLLRDKHGAKKNKSAIIM